jgi:hypothetical protein
MLCGFHWDLLSWGRPARELCRCWGEPFNYANRPTPESLERDVVQARDLEEDHWSILEQIGDWLVENGASSYQALD